MQQKQSIQPIYSRKEIIVALGKVQKLIETHAEARIARGFTMCFTDKETTYEDLRAYKYGYRVIPVYTGANSTSVWGVHGNALFRFWHDCLHIELEQDFSEQGERVVAYAHHLEALHSNLGELELEIIHIETVGQLEYFIEHGEHVNNQTDFLFEKLGYCND